MVSWKYFAAESCPITTKDLRWKQQQAVYSEWWKIQTSEMPDMLVHSKQSNLKGSIIVSAVPSKATMTSHRKRPVAMRNTVAFPYPMKMSVVYGKRTPSKRFHEFMYKV